MPSPIQSQPETTEQPHRRLPADSPDQNALPQTTIQVRVRYADCDPLRMAHHSVYPVWMEEARGELLRRAGRPYSELEGTGVYFVVARMSMRWRQPARYDRVLDVTVRQAKPLANAAIKVDHDYEIRCDGNLLMTGSSTLVCVDREGKPRTIPAGAAG